MNLQTSINILQNRDWSLDFTGKTCSIYTLDDQYLVIPFRSVGRVPSGTLDSMFRSNYTIKEKPEQRGNKALGAVPVLNIILEKQGSQTWGRIEQHDFLAVTTGNNPETVAKKLSMQLLEFTDYMSRQHRQKPVIPTGFVFDYLYDLTRVRELFQQFRISSIAEQTNISQDLLNQFMTSKQHPSPQQAQQIETLIQQFGNEMINFSLL